MDSKIQGTDAVTIPKSLIYEIVDDSPIYYKGYKDYFNGKKQPEELTGSSYLPSLIITQLVYILMSKLGKDYKILTNELGLPFNKGTTRAADIAIISKERAKQIQEKHQYLNIAPEVVIEVDIKADIEEEKDSFSYINQKTDQLLQFGVEKVIWILTESGKVMVAEQDKNWEITGWDKSVNILHSVEVIIQSLTQEEAQ